MKRLSQLSSEKIKWAIAFCSFSLLLINNVPLFAEDKNIQPKFGYVELQKVVYESDAGIKAKREIEALIKEKQALVDEQAKKIRRFEEDIEKKPYFDRFYYKSTLENMRLQLKQTAKEAEETIRKKDKELRSDIVQELIYAIKRFGKKESYTFILEKKGLDLLEKNSFSNYRDAEPYVIYKDRNIEIDGINKGVEDFDDITRQVIAFFNSRTGTGSEETADLTEDLNKEKKKENLKLDISVEVWPELFPVIAKFLSEGNYRFNIPGLVKWKLHNEGSETVKISVASEVAEWTPPVINTVDLGPYETKELEQTPFGKDLFTIHSRIPATLILKAKIGDKVIYEETRNIGIKASDDMIWSLYTPWDTEYLIAAWVTPKEPKVEQILTRAKEKLFGRRISGYLGSNMTEEVKAIFNAVRKTGVSYVNSSVNFGKVGFTQRVRLPKESISQKAANCIDGSVLLASLFENIGLEPLIILVPGHAFVGVRLAPGSKETLFIETTLVGRPWEESFRTLEFTYDAARKAGDASFEKARYESQYKPDALHIIDIKKAREMGIYPLW